MLGTDFLCTGLLSFHISVIRQFTFWHWLWFVRTNLQNIPNCPHLSYNIKNTVFQRNLLSVYSTYSKWQYHPFNIILQNIALKNKIWYMLELWLIIIHKYVCVWWHRAVSCLSIFVLKRFIFFSEHCGKKIVFLFFSYFHGPIHCILHVY